MLLLNFLLTGVAGTFLWFYFIRVVKSWLFHRRRALAARKAWPWRFQLCIEVLNLFYLETISQMSDVVQIWSQTLYESLGLNGFRNFVEYLLVVFFLLLLWKLLTLKNRSLRIFRTTSKTLGNIFVSSLHPFSCLHTSIMFMPMIG